MQLLRAKNVQHLLLSGQQTGRGSVGGWHQQPENQRVSALASQEASDRLDSWKEIAVYLQREVRTVQRWEKREGLPVHRHIHVKAGTIYAFKREIDTWLQTRRPAAGELALKKEHLSGLESGKLPGAYEDSGRVADDSGVTLTIPKQTAVSSPERRDPMRKTRIGKKDQSNSQPSGCRFRKRQPTVLFLMTCLVCTVSDAGTLKLYPPSKDQAGALRLAQVMQTATREEILKNTILREHLLASGLQDSDLKDGSLAMGRVYCCHPSTDEGTAIWFYVPPDKPVNPGDIVEVRMGREATKKDPGKVNALVEIRQKKDAAESHCSWDPPKEFLWRRLLYCDWMPAEGWTRTKGSHNTWLKRVPDATVQ